MPRTFDVVVESPARVEQLHAAFSDEEYWLARLAALGGRLDSLTVAADGAAAITVIQDLRQELLPGLVAKFLPADLRLVHKETWHPVDRGQMRGEISFAARGAPGSVLGQALLLPGRHGSRLEVTTTVRFRVPLVGGKIEGYIGGHAAEMIALVNRFTTAWVSGDA
jgi:hypothetical protein